MSSSFITAAHNKVRLITHSSTPCIWGFLSGLDILWVFSNIMIHGIGIEIVDVDRFSGVMLRRGERFLKRLFTANELDYCMNKSRPEESLAARFAAKKSFMKAVGKTVNFLDMEISANPDGRPELHAKGLAASFKVEISMSHDKGLAIGSAIASVPQ